MGEGNTHMKLIALIYKYSMFFRRIILDKKTNFAHRHLFPWRKQSKITNVAFLGHCALRSCLPLSLKLCLSQQSESLFIIENKTKIRAFVNTTSDDWRGKSTSCIYCESSKTDKFAWPCSMMTEPFLTLLESLPFVPHSLPFTISKQYCKIPILLSVTQE